jgi:hypothetical protein
MKHGQKPLSMERRLIGMHFPNKSSKRGQCVECHKKKGNRKVLYL